jgi:hypothetical protein
MLFAQARCSLPLTYDRIAEEIRSLSRFQVAQRTGFTKILKKYKRWTKDREFSHVFKENVSSRPDSLFQLDLSFLLDQYIDVLGALRAIFDEDGTSSVEPENDKAKSVAARISRTLEQGDGLDFDLALTTIPLGSHGNRATYWIHPDNFVEAQVLLLQQMRLYAGGAGASSRNRSTRATPARRQSPSVNTDIHFGAEDDVGLLVLDHAEAFAMKQNASTIGSTEATKGNVVFKAASSVHCVSSGEAAVVVRTDTTTQQAGIKTAKSRVESVQSFLDEGSTSSGDDKGDSTVVRQWLIEHQEVKPIAGVCSKRTRFVGLHNNAAGGIWATLDRDVYMKDSMSRDITSADWPSAARSNALKFPHAILEVRREGTQAASLTQALDRSHLVRQTFHSQGYQADIYRLSVFAAFLSKHMPFGRVVNLAL